MLQLRTWLAGVILDQSRLNTKPTLQIASLLVVFINLVVLCFYNFCDANTRATSPEDCKDMDLRNETVDSLGVIFLMVFWVEVSLKLFIMGMRRFRKHNKLDMCLCLLSLFLFLGFEMAKMTSEDHHVDAHPMRLALVVPVFRLFTVPRSIKLLVLWLVVVLRPFMYVFMFLLVVFFCYAILGLEMFEGRIENPQNTSGLSFDTLGQALQTLFALFVGEETGNVMRECMKQTNNIAAGLYFLSFQFVTVWLINQLFIGIVIDAFYNYFLKSGHHRIVGSGIAHRPLVSSEPIDIGGGSEGAFEADGLYESAPSNRPNLDLEQDLFAREETKERIIEETKSMLFKSTNHSTSSERLRKAARAVATINKLSRAGKRSDVDSMPEALKVRSASVTAPETSSNDKVSSGLDLGMSDSIKNGTLIYASMGSVHRSKIKKAQSDMHLPVDVQHIKSSLNPSMVEGDEFSYENPLQPEK